MRAYGAGLIGTAIIAGVIGCSATAGAGGGEVVQGPSLPASGPTANERLAASPRKAEWVTIRSGADSVRAWVVYPAGARRNAPVVLAIHDNQGMSNWIRAVADQLAAHGFIAIAPDLLSMQPVERRPDGESVRESVSANLGKVDQATRDRFMQAFGEWGTKQQGASAKYGVVGFCWGGSTVFAHAAAAPATLGAVVVYYGGAPAPALLANVRAPIIALLASNDARVNSTMAPADSVLKLNRRSFEQHYFDGAGHGFTRSQEGRPENAAAVVRAWPMTVDFFKKNLGS